MKLSEFTIFLSVRQFWLQKFDTFMPYDVKNELLFLAWENVQRTSFLLRIPNVLVFSKRSHIKCCIDLFPFSNCCWWFYVNQLQINKLDEAMPWRASTQDDLLWKVTGWKTTTAINAHTMESLATPWECYECLLKQTSEILDNVTQQLDDFQTSA